MTNNVEQFNSAGIERVYWAVNSTAGYPYGIAGAIANGGDAGMGRIIGTQSFALPLQPPRQVSIPGDDSVQAIYFFQPETLPNGDLVLGNIDLNLWAKSQGITVYADGDWDAIVGQPDSPTFNQLTLITISQAKSAMSGSVGNAGWMVNIYPRVQLVPMGNQGLSNATATNFTHQMIANVTDKLSWGTSFSVANNGTTRAAVYTFYSENRVSLHTHVSNASDVAFTLDYTPAAATAAKIKVYRNGTLLTITTDWSVSGSTITLVAAGSAGDVVICRYEHS
jgi:hypothetical protein